MPMQTFREWMEHHEEHPFNGTAVRNGFKHENTSTKANTSTHEYSHPAGHTLQLHTNSQGHHSFKLRAKSGQEHTGDTAMRLHGASLMAK